MPKRIVFLLSSMLLFAACTSATPEPTITPTVTNEPPTTEPTTLPSATPMSVEDLPAIELLAGTADTCVNVEDYGDVLGFEAHFYETTTDNRVVHRMTDGDGNVLFEDSDTSENKDGEEGWGFYPLAYDLPDNSLITMEITVYASQDDDAPATSLSTLTYNCTTGETIATTFTRNP
jgi:hypothetical protein